MFGDTKNMIWMIVIAAAAVYSIFSGIKTMTTGKMNARAEESLRGFSERGIKQYKKAYSVVSILGGLLALALTVVLYLGGQNVIADTLPYKIGFLVVGVLMVVILLVIKSKCKKTD